MKPIFLLALSLMWTGLPRAAFAQETNPQKTTDEKAGAVYSLDDLLDPKKLWELTPETVEIRYKNAGFRWLSEASKDRGLIRPMWRLVEKTASPPTEGEKKTPADDEPEKETEDKKDDPEKTPTPRRFSPQKTKLDLLDGQVQAEEVNFEFKEGKLAMLTISIWNKGDSAEDLNENRFKKLLTDLNASLSKQLAVRAQDMGRDQKSASKAERIRWELANTLVQLESSSTKDRETGFQPEFIRVRLAPKVKLALGATTDNVAKVTRTELTDRVKKIPTGDVYVEGVPMVDQGEKGYCALATAERVMRFYGIECDQHDMAKASGGDAFGTNPQELQEALHRLQGRFKIRVRDLIHWDINDYLKFTEVYNREAKRVGAKPCPENRYLISFRGLDKDALRNARTKGAGYERFVRNVKDLTGRGVPLLWGMELGIYPENGEPALQGGGGHMRLIIGFNEKKEELLFSDSWGAGHELKRMSIKDAYVVTKGLYMIEPTAR